MQKTILPRKGKGAARRTKAIAFDLGNVAFNFDYSVALDKIKNKIGVPTEKIWNALFYENFALDFEKGIISSYDFYLNFRSTFRSSLKYKEFVDIWCRIFFPNGEVISIIEQLKSIYPVYLISNINELHFNYLHKEFRDFFSLFDATILSFKVKSIKPEKKIYQELIKISGRNPQQIIYIDDRQDLITAAKKMGFNSIRFMGGEKLLRDLIKEAIYLPKR